VSLAAVYCRGLGRPPAAFKPAEFDPSRPYPRAQSSLALLSGARVRKGPQSPIHPRPAATMATGHCDSHSQCTPLITGTTRNLRVVVRTSVNAPRPASAFAEAPPSPPHATPQPSAPILRQDAPPAAVAAANAGGSKYSASNSFNFKNAGIAAAAWAAGTLATTSLE
jgi:hypothetical protein